MAGMTRITGDTTDTSERFDFEFYERVWFWDNPHSEDNPVLGRWLGVSHRIGSAMCYWVVKCNGQVLSRITVQHVSTELDMKQGAIKESITTFDKALDQVQDDDAYYTHDGLNEFTSG